MKGGDRVLGNKNMENFLRTLTNFELNIGNIAKSFQELLIYEISLIRIRILNIEILNYIWQNFLIFFFKFPS